MLRKPAVAGQFYPADAIDLRQTIQDTLPPPPYEKTSAIAVVSPHAGYVYSGAIAAETFSRVTISQSVIILGPNHRGRGSAAAVMDHGEWEMPMGTIPIEPNIATMLLKESSLFQADTTAHTFEHSLEVQVPFLQYFNTAAIVPICLSQLSYQQCEEIGMAIARVISKEEIKPLIVASTDMTHYESREIASRKDQKALTCITNLDPEGLYHTVVTNQISMCGFIPTAVMLIAAKELGAQKSELVRYTDSGEVSGDTNQVVGYAGFVIA